MGRYPGMIGADPLYQEWQKAGCPRTPLPKRLWGFRVLLILMVGAWIGILVWLLTNANWKICTPILIVYFVIVGYLWYSGKLYENRPEDNRPKRSPKHDHGHDHEHDHEHDYRHNHDHEHKH